MGNLFKKKNNEPIKKVNVKTACACSGQVCSCGCSVPEGTKGDASTTPYGYKEAAECARIYYDKEAHYPIS